MDLLWTRVTLIDSWGDTDSDGVTMTFRNDLFEHEILEAVPSEHVVGGAVFVPTREGAAGGEWSPPDTCGVAAGEAVGEN
ncbi:Protein of unknown function [Gryllus bimaculatus]|nr:Protein of unknown function [Gryllus bimaculatus]